MKILRLHILCLSLFILSASSCTEKDYEEKLPPETQEGRYTFGCLVNGEIWLPEGIPLSVPRLSAGMNKECTYLAIAANQAREESILILINNEKIIQGMTISLNVNEESFAIYTNTCDIGFFCEYRSTALGQGELTITKLDTTNRIISGRFSFEATLFDAQNPDCSCASSFSITEGRFDMKYSLRQ
ncbi:MAG: DUF6252 family protein [Tenuifilaceae bacterium]|nr:DUF6252 family protein [Tenuifilaceae bacterium]